MIADTGLAAVVDTSSDDRDFNLLKLGQEQGDTQIAGDYPQRQMGYLPGKFNHRRSGIEDDGVPGLD